MPSVLLTNEKGEETGIADILAAHTGKGLLHRAFSVYVFRNMGTELLIQKRAATKMLWPLIWVNTCCSHPQKGETPVQAGMRRLREELGFTCHLTEHNTFIYRAEDPAGRGVEHEYLILLVGNTEDAAVHPNPTEVADWKWISTSDLQHDMQLHPEKYAPWLHLGLPKLLP